MGQKKYKLFSTKDGGPKVCAFYFSEQGCKNESNCKFLHVKPGEEPPKSSDQKKNKKVKQQVINITNSDISSESSSDSDSGSDCSPPPQQPPQQPPPPSNTPNKKKKSANKNSANKNSDMFYKQTEFQRKPATKPTQPNMTTDEEQESLFVDPYQPKLLATNNEESSLFVNPRQRQDYQPKEDNRKERRKLKRKEYEGAQLQQQQQDSNENGIAYVPTFLNPASGRGYSNPNIFASMATSPPQQAVQQQKTKKTKKSKTSKTESAAPAIASLGTFASMAAPPPQQQTFDFRSMNLPIASFSAMPNTATNDTPNKVLDDTCSSEEEGEITESEEEEEIVRHEEYTKWKLAIDETKKHPKYTQYEKNIQEVKENMPNTTPWVIPKVYNPTEHKGLPQVIAIDCEMCRTQNPDTNEQDSKALCRISIVNGANPKDDVLLDTLVKPTWPIIDDVSFIHGITSQKLENVQFTMAHVNYFLSSLCTTETIIIGHGLINDFLSMRLDYSVMNNIIDTAFLYKVSFPNQTSEEQQLNTALPSLQELANTILTKNMPTIHDSVNDAQTAFYCADYFRTQNGNVPIILKTTKKRRDKRNDSSSDTLFLHRLPQNCTVDHITQLFQIHTSIIPKNVQPINFNPSTNIGKTFVIFTTTEHANLAFDTFAGDCVKDASGRNQKRIYLRGGGHVCVRKMIMDDSDDDSSSIDGE